MVFGLVQAHAVVMILAWMLFGSTGILVARYGRSLRIGNRRQLLGKAVWFQIHRFLLSLTPLLTLLGFLLILVRNEGRWVNPYTAHLNSFLHSVFGGIIVCCVIVQIWLALYRCHPQSRFRFIFDWTHRITGILALSLVIPTIFLIILLLSRTRPNLVPIFSCWTAWIVILIIILEKIQHQQRTTVLPLINNVPQGDPHRENNNTNVRLDGETRSNPNVGSRRHNQMKLLLLFVHIIISIVLSVLFIVYTCL